MNISEITRLSNCLTSNNTVSLCPSGTFQKDGIKERILRVILPGFARKRDIEVANLLMRELEKIPSQHSSTPPLPETADYEKVLEASSLFMEKVLGSYLIKGKSVTKISAQIKNYLDIAKIAKTLHLPHHAVRDNPAFVSFVMKNHLHHKIDTHYQNQGLGIIYQDGDFFLMHRAEGKGQPVAKSWKTLPVDKDGIIQGMELMAHGWEQFDSKDWAQLKPIKILNASECPIKNSPAIELVTADPTYDLQNLGLGMFGHAWLRLYEPIKDSNGQPTGKVAFYSLGYVLEGAIKVPDLFEFLKRKQVSTIEPISEQKLNETKVLIENLQNLQKKKMNKEKLPTDNPELLKFYGKTLNITCGNFASEVFRKASGKKIGGRPIIMRILAPSFLNRAFDKIFSKIPLGPFAILVNKIRFFTHGYFPAMMVNAQRNPN